MADSATPNEWRSDSWSVRWSDSEIWEELKFIQRASWKKSSNMEIHIHLITKSNISINIDQNIDQYWSIWIKMFIKCMCISLFDAFFHESYSPYIGCLSRIFSCCSSRRHRWWCDCHHFCIPYSLLAGFGWRNLLPFSFSGNWILLLKSPSKVTPFMDDDASDVAEDLADGVIEDEGRRQVNVLSGVATTAVFLDVRRVTIFHRRRRHSNIRQRESLFRLRLTEENKSNRTTMRPLCIYLIGISMYILNMIHFLMILAYFDVFPLMVTDGHTDGRTYGRTYGRTDPLIQMRGRI